MKMLQCALAAILVPMGMMLTGAAEAQSEWPTEPVRLLVPYPPGGNVDLIGRTLSPALTEALGQPVVVENRTGAGGTIAAGAVAAAEPDGYTILIGDIATHGINPHVYDDVGYDPREDFEPIVQITSVSLVLGVGPKLEVQSIQELIELARSSPEVLDYASGGTGTPQHLAFEYLKSLVGIEALHIPYGGLAPARMALIAGEVGAFIDGTLVPSITSGEVRALAVTGQERSAALPDVPTMAEAGVPNLVFTSWHGLFAPAGTDPAIIERLNSAVNSIITQPEFRQRFAELNIGIVGGSSEEFADHVDAEIEKLGELVRLSGARSD